MCSCSFTWIAHESRVGIRRLHERCAKRSPRAGSNRATRTKARLRIGALAVPLQHGSKGERRIAIQRWTQVPVVIDFIDFFTSKNFLRNGFTAYFVLFPENGSFA